MEENLANFDGNSPSPQDEFVAAPSDPDTSGSQRANTDLTRNTINEHIMPDLQPLLLEMQGLRQEFDTRIKYDESKERIIDTLHQELQSYREDLHFKILRPLFIDLITMYDDMGRLIENTLTRNDTEEIPHLHNLQSFHENIEEILRRNGLEAYQVSESTFVAGKQRTLKAIPTSDSTLDRQIARRVRKGFFYDKKILRPEIVETYKYVAAFEQ